MFPFQPFILFFVLFSEGREDEVWSLRDCCCPSESSHRTCSCLCSCCACTLPSFPRSQSLKLDSIPLYQLHNTSLHPKHPAPPVVNPSTRIRRCSTRRVRRHPLIPSKTVVEPPVCGRSDFFSSLDDNKKSNSVACLIDARIMCREKLLQAVPNKLSSTGVRVFYFCDIQESEKTNKTGTRIGCFMLTVNEIM